MNRADSQAFPRPASSDVNGRYIANEGATLREYLTGQALVGMLALNSGSSYPLDYQAVAETAVGLADLTLIALEDVTHEDAVKQVEEARVDPVNPRAFAGLSRGPLPEGETVPAGGWVADEAEKRAAAEAETPQPVISYVPPAQPVRTEAVGQTAPDPKPFEPEYEQPRPPVIHPQTITVGKPPRTDGETSEDPKA